ncbi:MAG: ABC transporter ATP-binding protein [Deltaproteobacteria bacterium]|nr:ABC transporter ATP-binding protein [Deltaproteobacteria bacterium]
MSLVVVEHLQKWFTRRTGLLALLRASDGHVRAVDDVSFAIGEGETVGLAGESGSGKTTVGMLLLRLQEPTAGRVLFAGEDIVGFKGGQLKAFRRRAQMIFQDPYQSVNGRFRVVDWVREPLVIHGIGRPQEQWDRVVQGLERAELRPPEEYLLRYPHELSGGQRQRVAIARAIVLEPRFIVADEPTSMLDVSVRAGVLTLLRNLQRALGLSMLFISHDFSTIRVMCDRTIIMYLGKIVEVGPTAALIARPYHFYTRALLAAIPRVQAGARPGRAAAPLEAPDQVAVPKGCRFAPRCSHRRDSCSQEEPPLLEVDPGRWVACPFYTE